MIEEPSVVRVGLFVDLQHDLLAAGEQGGSFSEPAVHHTELRSICSKGLYRLTSSSDHTAICCAAQEVRRRQLCREE